MTSRISKFIFHGVKLVTSLIQKNKIKGCLISLRLFTLSGMIIIITSDEYWGYRKRNLRRRCLNLLAEDDLRQILKPASITEEECPCQKSSSPVTTWPPPATNSVTEERCPCQKLSQPVTICPPPATCTNSVTDIQFYLNLGTGLGSFVFGVLVTIAIHAIIQRNKIAIEKKSNKTSRKEVPEHAHCGYIEKRTQYQMSNVTQGIDFYDRVEEDELYEDVK